MNTDFIGSHILNIQEEKSINRLESELELMDQSVIRNLEDVIDRTPKEYISKEDSLEIVQEETPTKEVSP